MDDGEVIVGLEQSWSLGGAKLTEWGAGIMAIVVGSELVPRGHFTAYFPFLLLAWLVTTFGLAGLRRQFPDEEKGVRNAAMAAIGIAPAGIPAPSSIHPVWSGAPIRSLDKHKEYVTLKLDDVYAVRLEEMLQEYWTELDKK
jgi:hypothetical protein